MKSSREHLQMAGIMLAVIIPNKTAEPAIRDQARTYLAYSGYLLARFHTEDADEKISLYREAVKQFDKSLRSPQIGPQFRQYTRKGLMKTLTYLGFEEFELDRFKQSKKHFHQALEIIEENFPEMEFWERLVHSNLVAVEERLGNPN